MDVSRETIDALQKFSALVEKWTAKINLVSKATVPDIWERHILDSCQIFDLAGPFSKWVDLGSGGGFPGIVCAIIARERQPDAAFVLVESDARKCAFLREAVRTLGLPATILNTRIESTPNLGADVLSARALANMSKLCEFSVRHRKPEGVSLFPKGATYQAEISDAQATWSMDYAVHPSTMSSDGVILKVGRIIHV